MNKGDTLVLIPVGQNGRPEKDFSVEVLDKKNDVVTVTCGDDVRPGNVICKNDTQSYLLRAFIRDSRSKDGESGSCVVQLQKDCTKDRLFAAKNLSPYFDNEKKQLEYHVPRDTLIAWHHAGVLEMTVDSYSACPSCRKMVTSRTGCRACCSPRWKSMRLLLRHKPCGYIGHGTEFANWFCPQCEGKVEIGSWDSFPEPAKCLDCGFMNSSMPYYVGTCLGCSETYPLSDCIEMPTYRFRIAN